MGLRESDFQNAGGCVGTGVGVLWFFIVGGTLLNQIDHSDPAQGLFILALFLGGPVACYYGVRYLYALQSASEREERERQYRAAKQVEAEAAQAERAEREREIEELLRTGAIIKKPTDSVVICQNCKLRCTYAGFHVVRRWNEPVTLYDWDPNTGAPMDRTGVEHHEQRTRECPNCHTDLPPLWEDTRLNSYRPCKSCGYWYRALRSCPVCEPSTPMFPY